MRLARRLILNLAVILASTAVALGAAEGLSRLIYPPLRDIHWYHHDPRYTMRHRANMAGATQIWGDGATWHFRTNARGFRGEDWPANPAPGERRVLVMGDSYTFGNAVEQGQTFPETADRLAQAETSTAPHWRVLNLGVVAWGPQNALAYVESEGADIGASCLVYAFFLGNDVVDNVFYGLYSLRQAKLVATPLSRRPDYNPGTLRRLAEAVPGYDFLLQHSELFNVLRRAAVEHLSHEQAARGIYNDISPADFAAALDLNDATLDRLDAVARQRFGAFGLILIPMLSQIVPAAASPFPVRLAELSYDRVRRWAAARDVPVLDFYADLRRNPGQAPTLYFKRDFHLNAAGDARLGALLATSLSELCRKE